MNSDTPRTDAAIVEIDETAFVPSAFARQLERELNEAQASLKRWRKAASPVTENPKEDAFYEKCEAEVK